MSEKVIKAFECCKRKDGNECKVCPYTESEYCVEDMVTDALELLKEQKIGHWILLENCSNFGVYCSECHVKVFDGYPFKKKFSYFCPHCGTRMEGEIEKL